MISLGRLATLALACSLLYLPAWAFASEAKEIVKRAMADTAMREALIREGRSAAAFCANCHGDAGLSRYPEVPNLAQQHPEYLLNQIDAFISGKRKNEFMERLMRVLSEREKASIALAFASAPAAVASPKPGPLAAQGADHYRKLCAQCHLPNAHSTDTLPRLAGQQPEYLRLTLRRYLTMSGERTFPPMTDAVKQLGEQNIEAVVQYLSNLK